VTSLREAIAKAVREDADPLSFAQDQPLEDLLEHIRARTGKSIVKEWQRNRTEQPNSVCGAPTHPGA
jgi:hypothetical protein